MSLHDKLVAIQSDLKAPKGQTNSFGKYKYRSCEDILEALKPLLKEQGCTLTLTDEVVMIGTRFYVKATATISCGEKHDSMTYPNESVSAFAREEEMKKGMDGAQITGASSSYARKYALNGLFCIDDTKDADSMDNRKPDKPFAINEKTGDVEEAYVAPKKIKEDLATKEQIEEIGRLCTDTGTNFIKLKEYFKIVSVPTKEQAQKMIVSLKAKLSKQLDGITTTAPYQS